MITRAAVSVMALVGFIYCQQNIEGSNTMVTLRALRPKGFRAYISAIADITNIIFFDGILYDSMENAMNAGPDSGLLWGAATRQADGDWLFEDFHVSLTVGTVIRYSVFIPDVLPEGSNKNGRASLTLKGNQPVYQSFIVTVLEDPSSAGPNCLPTVTKVRGRQVCAGEVIFEDKFDSLQEDMWQVEQYIPVDHPDYPFVSYQKLTSDPNVFVLNGSLNIVPKLQEDLTGRDSILDGTLNFPGKSCTRRECSKIAFGSDILPPIVSGRLTSIPFAFTYGTIHVRAKLPVGNWLYPEILLEPLINKYGGRKAKFSTLNIARPTTYPTCNNTHVYSQSIPFYALTMGDFYHDWSLKWTPESIDLSVDGRPYLTYKPEYMEMVYRCLEGNATDFHPSFDDYLHVVLGVAAGGIDVFSDNFYRENKPWRNGHPKASFNFWQNQVSWLPTWSSPSLVVDYVKVIAL